MSPNCHYNDIKLEITAISKSIREFKRQALCASRLKFLHPTSRNEIDVKISLPPDLKNLLNALENDRDFSE